MAEYVNEKVWPPNSARQALLSSPSGKRRYADFQAGNAASPIKRTPGTPSLLDRLRLARNNEDQIIQGQEVEDGEDEDEDDEETLQLQLAAIEAKLKLKKLQNKSRKAESLSRPISVTESFTSIQSDRTSRVEVVLSPARRPTISNEQKSPSRVLLGIDKGIRGADISLRRAKTVNNSPTKDRDRQLQNHASCPTSSASATRSARGVRPLPVVEAKSFSERMAGIRDNERMLAEKQDSANKSRVKKFKIDAAEVESFKTTAEATAAAYESNTRSRSPIRNIANFDKHSQELLDKNRQKGLRKSKTLPDLRQTTEETEGKAALYEGFSKLHLSSRILPHSFLKRTLPSEEFKIYKIPDLLKVVTSPAYELPDDVGNFVVFGVVACKSNPRTQKDRMENRTKKSNDSVDKWDDGSQNRKKFMVLTLTDLKWTIDLFLFDTALPRYHRLTPGTVIAVLNPSIMPPKRGKEDTGAFSLALHDGDDTVLEIGTSKHLGYCTALKRDVSACGQWVNSAKTTICEWHLNAQIAKTQSGRMGVNTGANGFGGRGRLVYDATSNDRLQPRKKDRGYDLETNSQYFISTVKFNDQKGTFYKPDVSTARMLDLDEGMFVAEGQFQRDKEATMQRRLAHQEKERSIARQLAKIGGGSSAGADYMRRKADNDTSFDPRLGNKRIGNHTIEANSSGASGTESHTTARDLKTEIGKKRAAEDVRLSPVKKKTRFLTDKGIREAGRESMGLGTASPRYGNDDDDDDDLDII